MKHKYLVIILTVFFLLTGCNVGEMEEREFEFKKVFFNGPKTYTFEIGHKVTEMKRYHFNCATPVIHYGAIENNYCKYKGQEHWNWGYKYISVEIHLNSSGSVSPGTEDRGKFGLHPWSEIK